jgi:hypothetical protein
MSDTPDYVHGEPAPQQNFNPSVHDLLVNDAKHGVMGFGASRVNDFIKQQMVDIFRARKAYGYKKYATILQAENGRDFLNDSLEETVDQLAYIRQGLEENPGNEVLKEAYRLAVAVLRELLVFRTRRDSQKEVPTVSITPDPLLGRVE